MGTEKRERRGPERKESGRLENGRRNGGREEEERLNDEWTEQGNFSWGLRLPEAGMLCPRCTCMYGAGW